MSELSLEERTIGHLLVNPLLESIPPWMIRDYMDPRFLDEPFDINVIIAREKHEIGDEDREFVDVMMRNPFLLANFQPEAKKILIKAIEKFSYNIDITLLSVMSDPHSFGYHRFFKQVASDVFSYDLLSDIPHTPAVLVFYHELAVALKNHVHVDREIGAYIEAYMRRWQPRIRKEIERKAKGQIGLSEKSIQIVTKLLADYSACLKPEGQVTLRPSLLEGDRHIIKVLASLTSAKLEGYIQRIREIYG